MIKKWSQSNENQSKILGLLSFVLGLVISMLSFGYASGFLFWLVSLMLCLSLMIVLSPLKIITGRSLLLFVVILLTFEFFL